MEKNYIFATDLNKNSGEGILGLSFIKQIYKKNFIYIIDTPYKKIKKKKLESINLPIKKNFYFKYLSPIIGAFKLRINSKKYKNLYFVNFIPLWNFLIFLILPKKTKIGPITGRSIMNKHGKKNYLLIVLYALSAFIIKNRFKNIIFSTSLLEKFFKKKNYLFDFSILTHKKYLKKDNTKKSIDILIYNRDHSNKFLAITNNQIKYLASIFNIFCIGKKLQIKGVKNKGFMNREGVFKLMQKSKSILSTTENLYSLFVLDGLHFGCKVIVKNMPSKKYFDETNFILSKEICDLKKIKKLLNTKQKKYKINKIRKLQFKYKNYFKLFY